MKLKLLLLGLAAMSVPAFTSCDNNNGPDNGQPTGGGSDPVPIPVESVTIDETLSMQVGDERTLTLSVLPENATDKSVTWNIVNGDIVEFINQETLTLKAKAEGTTTITVTTVDGGFMDECTVTVSPVEPVDRDPFAGEMILVEGGTYKMGGSLELTIGTFRLSKYEVTQKQWNEVMGAGTNPSENANQGSLTQEERDVLPVDNITITLANQFIAALNELTGKNYRLPTEPEWEFAARGGNQSQGFTYAGGNDLDEVAWWGYPGLSGAGNANHTYPVGQKLPNELGFYDMSGNVGELVSGFEGGYPPSEERDRGVNGDEARDGHCETGTPTSSIRITRGGDWTQAKPARFAVNGGRLLTMPDWGQDFGFRVLLDE